MSFVHVLCACPLSMSFVRVLHVSLMYRTLVKEDGTLLHCKSRWKCIYTETWRKKHENV